MICCVLQLLSPDEVVVGVGVKVLRMVLPRAGRILAELLGDDTEDSDGIFSRTKLSLLGEDAGSSLSLAVSKSHMPCHFLKSLPWFKKDLH